MALQDGLVYVYRAASSSRNPGKRRQGPRDLGGLGLKQPRGMQQETLASAQGTQGKGGRAPQGSGSPWAEATARISQVLYTSNLGSPGPSGPKDWAPGVVQCMIFVVISNWPDSARKTIHHPWPRIFPAPPWCYILSQVDNGFDNGCPWCLIGLFRAL